MQPKRDIQQISSSSLIRTRKKYTKSSHHIAVAIWSLKCNISQSCCSLEVCLSSSRISRRQQWIIALFTQQLNTLFSLYLPPSPFSSSSSPQPSSYQAYISIFPKLSLNQHGSLTPVEHFLSLLFASQWRPPFLSCHRSSRPEIFSVKKRFVPLQTQSRTQYWSLQQ